MKPYVEKTLKRDDGSRVKIRISINVGHYRGDGAEYKASIIACEKGKRTWHTACNLDNYNYRDLSIDDRQKARSEAMLKVVSAGEILAVANELYDELKPIEITAN